MKFEMSATEFKAFCAHIQFGARLPMVEAELSQVRCQLEDAHGEQRSLNEDRDYLSRRLERANNENDELLRVQGEVQREIRAMKAEVLTLQDKLYPFRIERSYSRAFNFQLTGQKIFAIKEIRALLNIGLKEAKDVVEGGFNDGNHSNLITLTSIFRNLTDPVAPGLQRDRLRSLVSEKNASDETLDSILAGKFGLEVETQDDARQSV